jgi:hypothetical protein
MPTWTERVLTTPTPILAKCRRALHLLKDWAQVKVPSRRTTLLRTSFEFVIDITRRVWAHRNVWLISLGLDLVTIVLLIVLLVAH